jgi:hypothetical protein
VPHSCAPHGDTLAYQHGPCSITLQHSCEDQSARCAWPIRKPSCEYPVDWRSSDRQPHPEGWRCSRYSGAGAGPGGNSRRHPASLCPVSSGGAASSLPSPFNDGSMTGYKANAVRLDHNLLCRRLGAQIARPDPRRLSPLPHFFNPQDAPGAAVSRHATRLAQTRLLATFRAVSSLTLAHPDAGSAEALATWPQRNVPRTSLGTARSRTLPASSNASNLE